MKQVKRLLVFFIICLWTTFGISQDYSPVYLLSSVGDTISGKIRAVTWDRAKDVISHFTVTLPDGSEENWDSKLIGEYGVENGQRYYAKIWPHNGLRQFLRPKEDGKAQLFEVLDPQVLADRKKRVDRIVFDADFKESEKMAYYISSTDTELAIRVEKKNYEIVLRQVLKDCPEVTDKIGERKFRYNNLEKIIGLYNTSCP